MGIPFVLAAAAALMMLAGIPAMLVFFTCMVERRRFADGVRRGRRLLAGRWLRLSGLLLAANGALAALLILLYAVLVFFCALYMTLFGDAYNGSGGADGNSSAAGGLPSLFWAPSLASASDYSVLTAAYYRAVGGKEPGEAWDPAAPYAGPGRKKWFLRITAAAVAASLFLIWDMARNGTAFDWSSLGQTEITAPPGEQPDGSGEYPCGGSPLPWRRWRTQRRSTCRPTEGRSGGSLSRYKFEAGGRGEPAAGGSDPLRRRGALTWGAIFQEEFAGEGIPTLEEALALCQGRLKLNIELKDLGADSCLPEKTAEIIREWGMEEQCVISSVRLSYLERVKAVCPELKAGLILPAAYGRYYEDESVDFISTPRKPGQPAAGGGCPRGGPGRPRVDGEQTGRVKIHGTFGCGQSDYGLSGQSQGNIV